MRHDYIPGVLAHMQVDGMRLEEFQDEDQEADPDGLTTTRYVEAVPGSSFTLSLVINAEFLYPRDDIDYSVWLDGKWVTGKVHTALDGRQVCLPLHGVTEITEHGSYCRKFQFGELKTSDSIGQVELHEDLKNLGEVSIKLTRCVKKGLSDSTSKSSFRPVGGERVPEKALKGRAISTRTTLGAAERTGNQKFCSVDFPYGREPFAVLTFKYRSHKDLQIQGIISRSPSPIPLEERDPETLNADELRQLLDRRNQELRDLTHIKREKRERSTTIVDDENDGDDAVIITGRQTKRHRISQDSGVEIVDLTVD